MLRGKPYRRARHVWPALERDDMVFISKSAIVLAVSDTYLTIELPAPLSVVSSGCIEELGFC